MSAPPDIVGRVQDELEQLTDKLKKLQEFLEYDRAMDVAGEKQFNYLLNQSYAMSLYQHILIERLEDLRSNP